MNPIQSLQQQRLLLQLEYETEKQAHRRITEQMGLEKRVMRGDAWWPVRTSRTYYNSLNQLCIELLRTVEQDEDSQDHNFEFGRPVQFLYTGGKDAKEIKYFKFSASVSFVDGDRMVVALPDSAPLADLQGVEALGVELSFDETTYRAMFDALDRTLRAKGRLAYLRDLFYTSSLNGMPKAQTYTFANQHFPYLNSTQEKAVNEVLRAKDVAVVHGPPGTGKTTTLVEAVYATLMREPQVLVCAQSNMAIDWISEKLVDRGVSVLRLGNPSRVDDKMLSFTYERRFEAHPDYPQLWAIRKAMRQLRSQRKHTDGWHQKMERLKDRATELEIRINQELFAEAKVIACTLVGASHRLLDGQKFNTLFIDEAAQALEAACWIPMRRVGRVVIAGDHCQLPPTVKSIAALKAGLGVTLMERIAKNRPEAVTLLRTQYRMNDDIMRFSSEYFYDGLMESAQEVRSRGILDLDVPMEWLDTAAFAEDTGTAGEGAAAAPSTPFAEEQAGLSLVNRQEAELTIAAVEDYLNRIGRERILSEHIDIGIISPYRAQVTLLRQLLRKRKEMKPYRHLITVNTVDGFQGQERDVIVVSLVRSNSLAQIGFLRDIRRMNVAITRARMKLIILGSHETLARHPFYRRLWQYIQSLS